MIRGAAYYQDSRFGQPGGAFVAEADLAASVSESAANLVVSSITLSPHQLATLKSTPIEIASGRTGTVLAPVGAVAVISDDRNISGTAVTFSITAKADANVLMASVGKLGDTDGASIITLAPAGPVVALSAAVGAALVLRTSADLGAWGPVTGVAVTSGKAGTGFAKDDTFNVGTLGASGSVTNVGTAGDVTSIALAAGGDGYTSATGQAATATKGVGTGLQVDLTVAPAIGPALVKVAFHRINTP